MIEIKEVMKADVLNRLTTGLMGSIVESGECRCWRGDQPCTLYGIFWYFHLFVVGHFNRVSHLENSRQHPLFLLGGLLLVGMPYSML
jgi:hypothetical protein